MLSAPTTQELRDKIATARRRAIPIPWAPPMPNVDWIGHRRIYRRLVAEAVISRLRGVIPALESVDERWAAEAEYLIRVLDAASRAPASEAA